MLQGRDKGHFDEQGLVVNKSPVQLKLFEKVCEARKLVRGGEDSR